MTAQEALRRMDEITPGYDPIERFRVYQASDEILDAFTAALARAGWSGPSR